MGGAWFHFWGCAVAATALAKLDDVPKKRLRIFGVVVIYFIGLLLAVGSMYFAPQSLFPFLFLGGVLILVCWVWPKTSKLGAVAVAVVFSALLVPFAYGCVDGIRHMCRVLRLRSLGSKPEGVKNIEIIPLSAGSGTLNSVIRIVDRNKTATILQALQNTYPYSPNHETIRDPWQVTVRFRSGEKLTFELGRGNRAHPSAAWIDFDHGVYQNERLNGTLTEALAQPLWP
jgi:hypothetical protein